MEENKNKTEEKKSEKGMASEILGMLKKVIFVQWIIIGILILIIAAQSFYHDYKWSEFDTVVIDSNDGGNASYIGNDGDINNYGKSGSSQEEEQQEEKRQAEEDDSKD